MIEKLQSVRRDIDEQWIHRLRRLRETSLYKVSKLTLFFLLIVAVITLFDFDEVYRNLTQISWKSIYLSLACLFFARFLYNARLYMVLRGLGNFDLSVWYLLRVSLLAEFVSVILPSSLSGDAVRWFKLEKRTEQPGLVAVALVIDRILGLGGLLLLAFLTMRPLLLQLDLALSTWGMFGLIVFVGLMIGLVTLALWKSGRQQLFEQLRRFDIQPIYILPMVILAVLGHLFFIFAYYVLMQDLVPVDVLLMLGVTCVALLTRSIPISFLGIETSDASFLALTGLLGITSEYALVVLAVILGSRYLFAAIGLLIETLADGFQFLDSRKTQDVQTE